MFENGMYIMLPIWSLHWINFSQTFWLTGLDFLKKKISILFLKSPNFPNQILGWSRKKFQKSDWERKIQFFLIQELFSNLQIKVYRYSAKKFFQKKVSLRKNTEKTDIWHFLLESRVNLEFYLVISGYFSSLFIGKFTLSSFEKNKWAGKDSILNLRQKRLNSKNYKKGETEEDKEANYEKILFLVRWLLPKFERARDVPLPYSGQND